MTKGLPRRCVACGSPFDHSNLDKKLCRYCETALERMKGYITTVVYGRWEYHGGDDDMNLYGFCSNCHANWDEDVMEKFNYCPNCGAYMRGTRND